MGSLPAATGAAMGAIAAPGAPAGPVGTETGAGAGARAIGDVAAANGVAAGAPEGVEGPDVGTAIEGLPGPGAFFDALGDEAGAAVSGSSGAKFDERVSRIVVFRGSAPPACATCGGIATLAPQ